MFGISNFQEFLHTLIYILPAVVICLSVHEFAHAFIAFKMGDESQRYKGRMSLNPLRHMDFAGTICLIFAGFGWAKPVEVDASYFKNPKNGMMWTALAGPLSNFVLAFIAFFIYGLMIRFDIAPSGILEYFYMLFIYIGMISAGLGIFNLIPIPPLDGSKVLLGILDEQVYFKIMQYERYLSIVLLVLLVSGALGPVLTSLRSGFMNVSFDIIWTILGL